MASKPRKPKPFALTPPEPLEAQTKRDIKKFFKASPRVAFWWVANVGAGKLLRKDGTLSAYIEFNFEGLSDFCGFLVDGTAFFIEAKKWSVKKARVEQEEFLATAKAAGCVALIARSYEDVKRAIDAHFAAKKVTTKVS